MRTYRENFVDGDDRQGLTQDQLLSRMAGVSVDYAERYSHATVSRWESGRTRPTLHRLQVFGAALELDQADVAGLVLLAGLAPDFETAYEHAELDLGSSVPDRSITAEPGDGAPGKTSDHTFSIKSLFLMTRKSAWVTPARFGLLAVTIAACGYAMSMFRWEASWMPVAYVGFALTLVLGQHFLLPDTGRDLGEFFGVTVFVVLTTPLLQFAPLGMDHYNFYAIGNLNGTHVPHMLAILANLALGFAGAMMFRIRWPWRYSSDSALSNALRQAAWQVIPPVGLVYAITVAISNVSVRIQLAVLMPVIAAGFVFLLVLRNPEINPSERDRRFLISTSVALAIVATTLGIIAILTIYVSPSLSSVLPDHNLFRSWEIDFVALGYSRGAALEKVNLGYMWHAMCLLAYMVFVFGGYLLVSIYRAGRCSDPPTKQEPGRRSQEVAGTRLAQRNGLESSAVHRPEIPRHADG